MSSIDNVEQQTTAEGCGEDCDKVTDGDTERREKLKNFLWCSDRADTEMRNFGDIGDSIRKMKNTFLTRCYFHPSNLYIKKDNSSDFTGREEDEKSRMLKEHIDSNEEFVPPSWFKPLSSRHLKIFIELHDVIEMASTLMTGRKIVKLLEDADLGLTATDVDDLKHLLKFKTFNNIDFDEFIYSLAFLDLIKRSLSMTNSSTRPATSENTNVQSVLYTVLVLFTVTSSCVCYELPTDGIPKRLLNYFECRTVCMDRLSNCLYKKLQKSFQSLPNFQSSPYYHSLQHFRRAMDDCSKGNSARPGCQKQLHLNPYVHYLTQQRTQELCINETVVKNVFEIYTRNGCLLTCLPDVQNIPMVRNMIESDELKKIQRKKLRLSAGRTKINFETGHTLTKQQINCFTPAIYNAVKKQIEDMKERNRWLVLEAEAAKNQRVKCRLNNSKLPPGLQARFMEIFELYNPTDARQLFYDLSEAKSNSFSATEKNSCSVGGKEKGAF